MTRPRVPPDQRIRTAQACESCKRRKQKCNGLCPCNTCEKRNFICEYSDRQHVPSPPGSSAVKRKHGEVSVEESYHQNDNLDSQSDDNGEKRQRLLSGGRPQRINSHEEHVLERPDRAPPARSNHADDALQRFAQRVGEDGVPLISRGTSHSGDEEAIVYSQTRMLQDPTGRLLYIGDSGSLSYLQMLRILVENVSGPSPFTTDPRRHKIVEAPLSLPPSYRPTHLLPDQTTARLLADAFFVNMQGLVQVFERETFLQEMDMCYENPLATGAHWLCLLNLVFAIGLLLATPQPGTHEAAVLENLRNEPVDRSELFFQNAKSLHDPLNGIEDADFWSVQALLLMSIYMLSKSKRNASFALLGMAVRSAYSLGLHREESMVVFNPEERALRRNLWKSLFVVDRFLSSCLGRPTAISEDECSGDTLNPPGPVEGESFPYQAGFSATSSQTSSLGLEAAVRSCSVIGNVLKRIYQRRMISTKLAQELADTCKLWPKALAPILHWRQATGASQSQGMAILHVNLFYCHSIAILTRPFLLFIMNDKISRMLSGDPTAESTTTRHIKMGKFMEACIIASTHTVKLVQQAFDASYLPRRDPFVIGFLFVAALNLLANEYAMLYSNATDQYIKQAIDMMSYCAETDPQASRLLYIMNTFNDVVTQQRERKEREGNALHASMAPPQVSSPPQMPNTSTLPTALAPPTNEQYNNPSALNFTAVPGSTAGSSMAFPSNLMHPTTSSPFQNHVHVRTASASTLPSIANLTTPTPPTATPATAPPSVPPVTQPQNQDLFSSMLDLSALDGAMGAAVQDMSCIPDERIEFDMLWAWPTPAIGTPRFQQPNGLDDTGTAGLTTAGNGIGSGRHQSVNDGMIPLYGVVDG